MVARFLWWWFLGDERTYVSFTASAVGFFRCQIPWLLLILAAMLSVTHEPILLVFIPIFGSQILGIITAAVAMKLYQKRGGAQ